MQGPVKTMLTVILENFKPIFELKERLFLIKKIVMVINFLHLNFLKLKISTLKQSESNKYFWSESVGFNEFIML